MLLTEAMFSQPIQFTVRNVSRSLACCELVVEGLVKGREKEHSCSEIRSNELAI